MTDDDHRQDTTWHRVATGIVAFLGLYQGAVPLVARGLFDADQRFAPALWLSAPWWWVACLAVVGAMLGLLAVIDTARGRHAATVPAPLTDDRSDPADAGDVPTDRSNGYDALAGLVFLAGLYNGVAPFVARLVFDTTLLFALPLRLGAPWWWITSLAVIAATIALLALIDHAKQHRRPISRD